MRTMTRRATIFTLALLGTACGGNDSAAPPVASTLSVSPLNISFSDTATTRSLYLTTMPSGGRLEWQVVSKPSWLTVQPQSGVIQGSIVTVQLSASGLATAEPGTLAGKLDLISNGGAASVQLTAVVSANPIATASTSTAVPGTADTSSFSITNTGRGTLFWQVVAPAAWMTLAPNNGALTTGQRATVRITVDKSTLAIGTMTATITLKSNATGGDVPVPVSIVVSPTPRIVASTGRLVFPSGVDVRIFRIANPGKGPLTWSVGTKDSWLTLVPSSGTVQAGDSVPVIATIDRAAVPGGTAASMLSLASNAVNGPATIAVDVSNTPPLALGVRVLDHRVVDAEFSQPAGLIVTVSASPNRLNVLDTETGGTWSVALPLAPTAVSVRFDGSFAAVGHNAQVTLVNLQTRTVVRTYAVTADALDVVLANNGFVYVFPRIDQWQNIYAINLATGTQTQGATIYAGTLARLHPSGDFIYGANNGLSPSDFEKYDIRNGTPVMLYDSPYHGDYAFSGNLWFFSNGTRIVARSGNVFRASPVQAEDMLYAGKLQGIESVRWAAEAPARNRLYVLGGTSNPLSGTANISSFETAFLGLSGTSALPKMPGSGGPTVDVDGYYLFPSADGSRLYVLIKAVASAGLAQDWALAVLDTSQLP